MVGDSDTISNEQNELVNKEVEWYIELGSVMGYANGIGVPSDGLGRSLR